MGLVVGLGWLVDGVGWWMGLVGGRGRLVDGVGWWMGGW